MGQQWSYRQRFSLRASTMLLCFCLVVITFGISDPLYDWVVDMVPAAGPLLWRFGVNLERYLLSAAFFAMGFFIHSMGRRAPQLQFMIELLLGGLLYSLL